MWGIAEAMATELMVQSLRKFFSRADRAQVLAMYAGEGQKPPVSLRAVEWFVVNDKEVGPDYASQLHAYTRRAFDPFRRARSTRVVMEMRVDNSVKSFETTIGQMNFFKWFIEEGYWSRVLTNSDEVMRDMLSQAKCPKKKEPSKADACTFACVDEREEPTWMSRTLCFD